MIARKEKVNVEPDALDALIKITDGDLRKSIMMLQTASKFSQGKLTANDINQVSGQIPPDIIVQIYTDLSNP